MCHPAVGEQRGLQVPWDLWFPTCFLEAGSAPAVGGRPVLQSLGGTAPIQVLWAPIQEQVEAPGGLPRETPVL